MRGLVIGLVVGLAVLTAYASAHMGYMPMGGSMMYGNTMGEGTFVPPVEELTEVSGEVLTVYPMAIVLEDGTYIHMPWWFAANLGIKPGDEVKVKGFSYGNVITPTFIEVNGKTVGDESSATPVWMQGYQGYYYHCPMMGW